MIPVSPAPEPADFDSTVRQPGLRLIAEKIGEKPIRSRKKGKPFKKLAGVDARDKIPADEFKDYWREAIDDMLIAYNRICAYSCFRIHRVTGAASVDHMAPKSRRWDQVYEWSNYRLASSRMNARKNNFEDILDPFEIENGWFQLADFGFAVCANPELNQDMTKRVKATILRLNLNDEHHLTQREDDIDSYVSGDWSWQELVKQSPFVARELLRQGRLRPEDSTVASAMFPCV
ncbi:MAG: hypothetical protein DWH91_18350 [Planctomycetota bacterium]|nr:MAG: hypothetical protein DWH91_18350 [Planctomycetota bacterium]